MPVKALVGTQEYTTVSETDSRIPVRVCNGIPRDSYGGFIRNAGLTDSWLRWRETAIGRSGSIMLDARAVCRGTQDLLAKPR